MHAQCIYLELGSNIAVLQLKYCIISFDEKIFLTFYVLYQMPFTRKPTEV